MLKELRPLFPVITKIFADGGYQGAKMAAAEAAISREWELEIVKQPELRKFVVLPKRWIVERTFAWINRCRRLAKDFENLPVTRLLSTASPPSASCSESSVIHQEVPGQTASSTLRIFAA